MAEPARSERRTQNRAVALQKLETAADTTGIPLYQVNLRTW